jgi:outer membrane lipoprotein-sorting protein
MMHKTILCLLAGLVLLFAVGCRATPIDETVVAPTTLERIHARLLALETYQSEATITYKSNKGTNVYETLKQCRIDGKYRIEVTGPSHVAGNVTMSDGKIITQFNPRISGQVSIGVRENPERSEIFLTSFIRNYFASEEVSVSVGSFGDGRATVLETAIPGNHPYLATGRLWIENATLNPVKLVIYDPDMSERIIVNFRTFEYNIPLDDSLFTIQVPEPRPEA